MNDDDWFPNRIFTGISHKNSTASENNPLILVLFFLIYIKINRTYNFQVCISLVYELHCRSARTPNMSDLAKISSHFIRFNDELPVFDSLADQI